MEIIKKFTLDILAKKHIDYTEDIRNLLGNDPSFMNALSAFLKTQKVFTLFYYNLKAFPDILELFPEDFRNLMKKKFTISMLRNTLLWEEFIRIHGLAEKNGIRAIPLKGIALSRTIYPHFAARSMIDIDILIEKNDLPAFEQLIKDNGYKGAAGNWKWQYRKKNNISIEFSRQGKVIPYMLDVHHALNAPRPYKIDMTDTLARIKPITSEKEEVPFLSHEDTLITAVLHMRRSISSLTIKDLCDILYIIRAGKDSFDWDYVIAFAEKYHFLKSLWIFTKLSSELFTDHSTKSFADTMHLSPKTKTSLEKAFIQKSLFSADGTDKGIKRKIRDFILRMRLFDRKTDIFIYIFKILIPVKLAGNLLFRMRSIDTQKRPS